jgi:hypothetical protein
MMPDDIEDEKRYAHLLTLLSVSTAMVGVCLTAIGLVSVVESLNKLETFVDNVLAIAAMLFSLVTLLTFIGVRTNVKRTWRYYMLTLDILFCLGIVLIVVASFLLTFVVL